MDDKETQTNLDDLKNKISELENKKSGLETDLHSLKEFKREVESLGGLNGIKEALSATKEKEAAKAEATKDVEFFKSEITKYQTQLEEFKQSMAEEKLISKMKSEVEKAGGKFKLLEPILKKRIQSELVDGNQLKVEVKDSSGNPLLIEGRDATLKDLVDVLRQDEEYGVAFGKTNFTGSGSQPSQGTSVGGMTQSKWDESTISERMEWARKNPTKVKNFIK